jgi:hypothetical protein
MDKRLIVLCLALVSATPASPPPAEAHDGRLDQFGCHHDQNQKYYHCHEGPYTRLSFDSKNQMIEKPVYRIGENVAVCRCDKYVGPTSHYRRNYS